MPLRQNIHDDMIAAQKARNAEKTDALRSAWSAIRNEEIDVRHDLSDDETVGVLARSVKQLKDALADFRAGGRADLAEKNEREIALLETYLPAQLSDDDVRSVVARAVAETSASGPGDVGKVMARAMKDLKGRADGNRVRAVALDLLGS